MGKGCEDQSDYKKIYKYMLVAFVISLFGILPFLNIFVIFPLSFVYSLKSLRLVRKLPKKDNRKRMVALFLSVCVMLGIVFWWIVSTVVFLLISFDVIVV